jgi:hypothetical protein
LIESSVKQGRIAKTDIFDKQIGVNMKNERAFPTYHGGYAKCDADGMTLRDYFATGAVQNFGDQIGCQSDQEWFDKVAEGAYRMADAMLKAREA